MKHNWEYKPFVKVAKTIIPTSKIDKVNFLEVGNIPIVSQEEREISGYWNNRVDITPHLKPVIIFGDHSRVLKYIDYEFVVGADGVKIIEPNEGVKTKFLFHYLRWFNVPSLGYTRHFKLIKEAIYPVPPIAVQEAIVAELDAINDLIATRKEQLKELDNLAQSLFYDKFGDPITNPKGWEVKPLKDLCISISTGPFGSMLHKSDYSENGVPCINPQNIKYGKISYDGIAKVLFAKAKELTNYKLNKGDIIIARRGDLSKCAIISEKENGWLCGTGSFFLKLKDLSPLLFYYQYTSSYIQKHLNEKCIGATMPNLNQSILESLNMLMPPLSLQEQFAGQVEAIEAQKSVLNESLKELRTLLDSRMDYWFN